MPFKRKRFSSNERSPDLSRQHQGDPGQCSRWHPFRPKVDETQKPVHDHQQRGRGRPVTKIPPQAARCLIRLFVKTSTTFARLSSAFQHADGPEPQWYRTWLEKLTDTGPEQDTKLREVRLDEDLIERREAEQDRACDSAEEPRPARDVGNILDFASQEPAHVQTRMTPTWPQTVGGPEDDIERSSSPEGLASDADSQKEATSRVDEVPTAAEANGKKPKRFADFRKSLLLKLLTESNKGAVNKPNKSAGNGSNRNARRNVFIVRQCTVTMDPVQSRVGTGAWEPQKDSESDYVRTYHAPKINDEKREAFPSDVGVLRRAPASSVGVRPAVIILEHARLNKLSDADIVLQLDDAISNMSDPEQRVFLNTPDEKGVAALHLAIAYGYLATCGHLMLHHADHNMKTARGDRPHDFALAAERLAGQEEDYKLYARIMLCREHVRYGMKPPTPQLDPNKVKAKKEKGERRSRGFPKLTCRRKFKEQRVSGAEEVAAQDHALSTTLRDVGANSLLDQNLSEKELEAGDWPEKVTTLPMDPATPDFAAQPNRYITPVSMSYARNTERLNPWYPTTQAQSNSKRSSIAMNEVPQDSFYQPSLTPNSWHPGTGPSVSSNRSSMVMHEPLQDTIYQPSPTPNSVQGSCNPPSTDLFGPNPLTDQTSYPPPYESLYPGSLSFQHALPETEGWDAGASTWDMSQAHQDFSHREQQQQATVPFWSVPDFPQVAQFNPSATHWDSGLHFTPLRTDTQSANHMGSVRQAVSQQADYQPTADLEAGIPPTQRPEPVRSAGHAELEFPFGSQSTGAAQPTTYLYSGVHPLQQQQQATRLVNHYSDYNRQPSTQPWIAQPGNYTYSTMMQPAAQPATAPSHSYMATLPQASNPEPANYMHNVLSLSPQLGNMHAPPAFPLPTTTTSSEIPWPDWPEMLPIYEPAGAMFPHRRSADRGGQDTRTPFGLGF